MASHHYHHHFCHHNAAVSGCHFAACHQPPAQPYPYPHPSNIPQQFNPHLHEHYFQEQVETLPDPTVSALLRRISALEAALRRRPPSSSAHSLRDAAARTIQTHFRAFLVRRSRTLGQLRQLASIKSKLGALKSSVLGRSRFDYVAVHQKAVDLMLKLDGIEGGDPMIRDGKRSVTRELDKFLDFIDGFVVERRVLSNGVKMRYSLVDDNRERKPSNVTTVEGSRRGDTGNMRGLRERIEKLEDEMDKEASDSIRNTEVLQRKDVMSRLKIGGLLKRDDGFCPKVKKNVTFAKNDKVYRLVRRDGEQFLVKDYDETIDEDEDDDDLVEVGKETEDEISREIEVIGMSSKVDHDDEDNDLESQSESGGSQSSGDGEKGLEKLYVKK